MATNDKIYIGSVETPLLEFDDTQIEYLTCENALDIIGDELTSDALDFSLFYDDADGALRGLPYGTEVYYYSNHALAGKYFLFSVKRDGLKKYSVRCTSLIGLIEREDFYGGFYEGADFDEVLNDVLFSDSLSLTKWSISYGATNNPGSYLYPSRLYGESGDAGMDSRYWRYRLHIEFSVEDISSTTATSVTMTVAGLLAPTQMADSGTYSVQVTAARDSTTSPTYWALIVNYNGTINRLTLGSSGDYAKTFGDGTKFIVDVDPIEKVITATAEYIKYDDRSVTGTATATGTIGSVGDSTRACLGYAFGSTLRNSSGHLTTSDTRGINFYVYKVYDENGAMVINAYAAKNGFNNNWYMVNTCNGRSVANSYINPVGGIRGTVGSLIRAERDLELCDHIIYGEGVEDITVYGWIRKCTKREALHQLLFSQNVSLLKTDNGDFLFAFLSKSTVGELDELEFYDDSEEEIVAGAKQILVTENSYERNNTSVKIFDNTSSPAIQGDYTILFDNAPIFGTPVGSGITIKAFNCNAAIVSGRGTITGTVFSHSQSVRKYVNAGVLDGADVSVDNIGLITGVNADNVMSRLKAYYGGDLKKITNSIVYHGEKCGRKYAFKTLYSEENTGFLSKISARASSFVKAVCTFVSGYVPPSTGSYQNSVVFSGSASWTVPDDVRSQEYPSIRLNLIGKGYQGDSGESGEVGKNAGHGSGFYYGGEGGRGGKGGAGGNGGLIYTIAVDVTNVKRVDISQSGYNTIAKTYNDSGTLLNTYSSASGNSNKDGFTNVLTGVVYARKGADGIAGGKGGEGGSYGDGHYYDGSAGENVERGNGGQIVHYIYKDFQISDHGTRFSASFFGGGGGGAYNANGSAPTKTSETNKAAYTKGGKGANAGAARVVYTEYGSGGSGGNGGGGGGGAGVIFTNAGQNLDGTDNYTIAQTPGDGGTGSVGTPGIDGCIIIYY